MVYIPPFIDVERLDLKPLFGEDAEKVRQALIDRLPLNQEVEPEQVMFWLTAAASDLQKVTHGLGSKVLAKAIDIYKLLFESDKVALAEVSATHIAIMEILSESNS